jgi:hypothetical protein
MHSNVSVKKLTGVFEKMVLKQMLETKRLLTGDLRNLYNV